MGLSLEKGRLKAEIMTITHHGAAITIWEVKLIPSTPPTRVKTLPLPYIPRHTNQGRKLNVQFSPASGRLFFVFKEGVLVWDVQNSKHSLLGTDTNLTGGVFLSSDGCFLACPTTKSMIYLALLWAFSFTGNLCPALCFHTHSSLKMENQF